MITSELLISGITGCRIRPLGPHKFIYLLTRIRHYGRWPLWHVCRVRHIACHQIAAQIRLCEVLYGSGPTNSNSCLRSHDVCLRFGFSHFSFSWFAYLDAFILEKLFLDYASIPFKVAIVSALIILRFLCLLLHTRDLVYLRFFTHGWFLYNENYFNNDGAFPMNFTFASFKRRGIVVL